MQKYKMKIKVEKKNVLRVFSKNLQKIKFETH